MTQQVRQGRDVGSTSGQQGNMELQTLQPLTAHWTEWKWAVMTFYVFIRVEQGGKTCSVNRLFLLSHNFCPFVSPVRVAWRCWEEEVSRSPISRRRTPASTPAWRTMLTPPLKRRPNSPYKVPSTRCLLSFWRAKGKNTRIQDNQSENIQTALLQ